MADRQRRKGIQHSNHPHDQRNTRKPLEAYSLSPDDNEIISNITHSASFDDAYYSQQGRNNTLTTSSSHPRNFEVSRVRDSGYNTDVSPARTSSSTSTPAENFSFDYPERMTIREDPLASSPSSNDFPFIVEEQEEQYNASSQLLLPPRSRSSTPLDSRALRTVASTTTTLLSTQTQLHSPAFSGLNFHQRHHSLDNEDDGDDDMFTIQQLSRSERGSHNANDDILFNVEQFPSVPVRLCLEPNSDNLSDTNFDSIDGIRDGGASYSRSFSNASNSASGGLGIPLLPKSMSSSFQDLESGNYETVQGEEEENDVMTSSEETEMEMMMISKTRRFSLRKRHYSGAEEDDDNGAASSPIPNVSNRFSSRKDSDTYGAESDLSIQVSFHSQPPRDEEAQTSPELASSIKNACRFMIGFNLGSSTEQDVEEDDSVRRKSHPDNILTHSCSANSFLREENELCFERSNVNLNLEESRDSFDLDIDDDGDEDVFTFDMDDIQEYQRSQDSFDGDNNLFSTTGAQYHHPHPHPHSATLAHHHHLHQPQQHSAPATPRAPPPAAVPSRIVLDRPPISPSSRSSGRRGGNSNRASVAARSQTRSIHAHVQLAGGARLPWEECSGFGAVGGGFASSASTQTPHRASMMIDDIVNTPVALPSEARGKAYMHLRRGSVDERSLLRDQPAPLPDIVPLSRDRAQSAPNLHDVILRQRAQSTGRELRRLSDLFHENVVRRQSVHSQEDSEDQQSSSYPRMGPSYILRQSVRALVFGSFRARRDSSVDDESFSEKNDNQDF